MVNRVSINGVCISGSSKGNVIISNGKVIIDGKDVTPDAKEITIIIDGDVSNLEVDCCEQITITGNTGDVSLTNGGIDIKGSINGSVKTTNGSVHCGGAVSGSIKTVNGSIHHS